MSMPRRFAALAMASRSALPATRLIASMMHSDRGHISVGADPGRIDGEEPVRK